MFFKVLKAFLIPVILPATIVAQESKGYEITGRIPGLEEGEKVTMMVLSPPFGRKSMDSAYVKNGIFHITGFVPEGPRYYWLVFDKHRVNSETEKARLVHLVIDNGEKITINSTTDIHKIEAKDFDVCGINYMLTIDGSPYTEAYHRLLSAWYLYTGNILSLERYTQKIQDSIGFDGPIINAVFGSRNELYKSAYREIFANEEGDVPVIVRMGVLPLLAGLSNISPRIPFLWDLYESLNEHDKNSYFGKILKQSAMLSPGRYFPEFVLPTADGKTLALKDVVAKSKVTLVHFWGARSYQKEKMQSELRNLYTQYHDKGLNIIGFCSDKYADEWKGSVQEAQYPWYNVSDLKGKDGMVAKVYHEYTGTNPAIQNTTNVLIDAEGKIIAWDVQGVELQWYLWKYCSDK